MQIGLMVEPHQGTTWPSWVAGTVSQAVDQLGALPAAGVQEYFIQHLDQDDFDDLELVAAQVKPQVR